jgi:hypothetical protein
MFTCYKVEVRVLNRHTVWEGWTQIRTLMEQTKSISDALVYLKSLTKQSARENHTERYYS